MINVLLVDDHAVVRAGYRRLLEDDPDIRVTGEAENAEQGYSAYCRLQPDVGVIDLSMPGMGGMALIRRILCRDRSARLLAFSMHEDTLYVQRALEAGARGYVAKSASPGALIEAVRRVYGGARYLSPEIERGLAARSPASRAALDALSLRELEVLRLIAEGRSVAEISRALNLSPKTVANHQAQLKAKLGMRNAAALVHCAARAGLIKIAAAE